jgi:hypothetical protein
MDLGVYSVKWYAESKDSGENILSQNLANLNRFAEFIPEIGVGVDSGAWHSRQVGGGRYYDSTRTPAARQLYDMSQTVTYIFNYSKSLL